MLWISTLALAKPIQRLVRVPPTEEAMLMTWPHAESVGIQIALRQGFSADAHSGRAIFSSYERVRERMSVPTALGCQN